MNKGYFGLDPEVNLIIPKEKLINRILTATYENRNKSISEDRVIVEIFFERLCTIEILQQKQKWDESKIIGFFLSNCCSIANDSSFFNALRANDRSLFMAVHNRMFTIEEIFSKNVLTLKQLIAKNGKYDFPVVM